MQLEQESSPSAPLDDDEQELTDPQGGIPASPGGIPPEDLTFHLVFVDPSGARGRVLVTDQVQFIGRDPGCDIPLADTSASRKHCAVQLAGDGSVLLFDAGSANGTFVNERQVSDATLFGGEVVFVGSTSLRLERDPPLPGAGSPLGQTVSNTLAPLTEDPVVVPGLSAPPEAGPYFELTTPSGAVFYVPVTWEAQVIGRDPECDVPLPDNSASRQHCSVQFAEGGSIYVRDLDSANGTMVDGEAITETWLWGGERITLGESALVLCGPPAEGAEEAEEAEEAEAAVPVAVAAVPVAVAAAANAEPPPTVSEPSGLAAWTSIDATVFHNERAGDLRGMPLTWRGLVRIGTVLVSAELQLDAPLVPEELRCLRVNFDAPLPALSNGDEVAAYYDERRVASGTILQLLDQTSISEERAPRLAFIRTGGTALVAPVDCVVDLGERQVSAKLSSQDGPLGPKKNGHVLLDLDAPLQAEDGERLVLYVAGLPFARGYLGQRRKR